MLDRHGIVRAYAAVHNPYRTRHSPVERSPLRKVTSGPRAKGDCIYPKDGKIHFHRHIYCYCPCFMVNLAGITADHNRLHPGITLKNEGGCVVVIARGRHCHGYDYLNNYVYGFE